VAVLELLTIKIQQMNIESINDNIHTTPAITYSECYAQVFSRLFFGDCLIDFDNDILKLSCVTGKISEAQKISKAIK